jgi:TPR repeat protein
MMRTIVIALAVFLAGCATTQPAKGRLDAYDVVDCELPGAVIRIGREYATTGRARAVRTAAHDCAIRGGYYEEASRANYETALRVWLPPADDGDAQAQFFVGQIYEKGLGRQPDGAKAASWYERAAAQDYRPAQAALAMLTERGYGATPANPEAALALYRKAGGLDQPLVYASEVERREREIATLRAELEQARDDLRRERERLQRHRRTLEGRIESLEGELDAARARSDAAAIAAAQNALDANTAQRDASTRELAANQTQLERYAAGIDGLAAAQPPLAGDAQPVIELVEPMPIAVRGLMTIRVRGNEATQTIVARIRASSPIAQATINATPVAADADGLVRLDVALAGPTTPVEIAVVDRNGHSGKMPFLVLRENALPQAAQAATTKKPGRYYALVIGNAAYRHWDALSTPHEDAARVAAVLSERYGFEVTKLVDATRADVLRALASLREKLGDNDNLLVYYSGHGTWDKANLQAYWVPVDGEKDSIANHISSSDITDQLGVMRATQILVVADACYAGVMVRSVADSLTGAPSSARADWLRQRAQVTSRKVMSSGNIREVLDGGAGRHSIFAAAFISALEKRGEPFEAQEIYREIAPRVEDAARGFGEQQEPQYGQLRHAGHVGGDFLFVPKGARGT